MSGQEGAECEQVMPVVLAKNNGGPYGDAAVE